MATMSIEREVVIEAPIRIVWDTITQPDKIRQWFSESVELDLRPGGFGQFGFEQPESSEHYVARAVIESVEPPHRYSFRWDHPAGTEPRVGNSLHVEFSLLEEGPATTRLRVTETGFGELERPSEERAAYAEEHRRGWALYLERLRDYASTLA